MDGGTIYACLLVVRNFVNIETAKTHIGRLVASPDVPMRDEAKNRICSPPFGLSEKKFSPENRQRIHYPTKSLGKYQALKVAHNGLPGLVVAIGQDVERYLIRQEAISSRDVVVT